MAIVLRRVTIRHRSTGDVGSLTVEEILARNRLLVPVAEVDEKATFRTMETIRISHGVPRSECQRGKIEVNG